MAFSPQKGDVPISFSVFGGLVTNQSAESLPEGVSPDCQDVAFSPGSVQTRPGLVKVFQTPFPSGAGNLRPTVTYAKSFRNPTGGIENLYLDSNGALWWQDVTNDPQHYTRIGTVTAGAWGRSATAFGREYLAISDGLHGSDIPLQWDGDRLDRVTQDGPGAAPTVVSLALPAVNMAASGALVLDIDESDPAAPDGSGNYTRINMFTSDADVASLHVGDYGTLAGYSGASADMNGVWVVVAIYLNLGGQSLVVLSALLPSTTVFSTDPATFTVLTGTMVRANNTVTVTTTDPHGLKVGYRAQIANVPAGVIGTSVTSIAINNEDAPGLALVTTADPHGLKPGAFVNITGVAGYAVGAGIATISRSGGLATVTTAADHGLTPGAFVEISNTTLASGTGGFNGVAQVQSVVSSTVFTFVQTTQTDAVGTAATGAVALMWPVADLPTPTLFEVVAAPSDTTFQVAVNYANGTWTSGAVSFPWEGTFFVSAVLSDTSFQYQQYGPNDSTSQVGTVTPTGQAAPGIHQVRVSFLTRQGYVTRPSPPTKFVANGGQYISVSNIPIGPENVVARILEFTGALGAYFFYIPAPAIVNGQLVATATQINDNTTENIVLDFSDNTLFAGIGTSTPGNDTAAQIILDGALGFGLYASRLVTWGQRNRIQNLLNMAFDGGYLPTSTTLPTGWTPDPTTGPGGALTNDARFGAAWQMDASGGFIYQSLFQDGYGASIATADTFYRFRAWVKGGRVRATMKSGGLTMASATLTGSADGSWEEAKFSHDTPSPIPDDLTIQIEGLDAGAIVDEMSLVYDDNPYLNTTLFLSYVDNPEAFDGLTGKLGSTQDQHKVMDIAELRQTLYFLTQEPSGRLHQTNDNGVTEPAGWDVTQAAANCGALSAWSVTRSQADDSSASGGEEWFAWASSSGARIFGGDQPFEISREIRPSWAFISPEYAKFCWALNDPDNRTMYFGLTATGHLQGAPNRLYIMNYTGLDSAHQIASAHPVRNGPGGKMIATDYARKWSPWTLSINGAALMYAETGELEVTMFAGNGQPPGVAAGYGNVYFLNDFVATDADYGPIDSYWTSFMMPTQDQADGKLAGFRVLLVYVAAYVTGLGALRVTPLVDRLGNPWMRTVTRELSTTPDFDMEFAGCSAMGNRIALEFRAQPVGEDTDRRFGLQRVTAFLRKVARLPVRGSAR